MSSDLMVMDAEKIDLLKRTVCRGATDDEFALFTMVCKRTGLDPFAKQIYALKRRENIDGQWVERITHQTGIDGLRLIADRTGNYTPGREPTYTYDKAGKLATATAYIKKRTKDGTWHEVSATAVYGEYVQLKRDNTPTKMWAEKPHIMLSKCAEALALRRAFPAEMSGVYTDDEIPPHYVEAEVTSIKTPPTKTPAIAPPAPAAKPANGNGKPPEQPLPKDGAEFMERAKKFHDSHVAKEKSKAGELWDWLEYRGQQLGFPVDPLTWDHTQVVAGIGMVNDFQAGKRAPAKQPASTEEPTPA